MKTERMTAETYLKQRGVRDFVIRHEGKPNEQRMSHFMEWYAEAYHAYRSQPTSQGSNDGCGYCGKSLTEGYCTFCAECAQHYMKDQEENLDSVCRVLRGGKLLTWREVLAAYDLARSQPEEGEEYARGRLEQFLRMKKERPIDPTYWDMHEERNLREAFAPQPTPSPGREKDKVPCYSCKEHGFPCNGAVCQRCGWSAPAKPVELDERDGLLVNYVADAISDYQFCSSCAGLRPTDVHCKACTGEAKVAIKAARAYQAGEGKV